MASHFDIAPGLQATIYAGPKRNDGKDSRRLQLTNISGYVTLSVENVRALRAWLNTEYDKEMKASG